VEGGTLFSGGDLGWAVTGKEGYAAISGQLTVLIPTWYSAAMQKIADFQAVVQGARKARA